MGFLLLIQTFIICLITGILSQTFWFSYILFLVFLGGILILFIYVTSLASNEIFKFSFNLFIISFIIFIISIIIIIIIDPEYININNQEIINNLINISINENLNNVYKIYNFPINFVTCFLINYLFLTLIISVKITNFFYGPLRNLN